MIEDLEGATSEPSRRTHVAVLSTSVAAVSLVLLFVLVAPPPRINTPPLAASPAPSLTRSTVVTFASGPAWVRSDRVSQLGNYVTTTLCVAAGSNRPAELTLFDPNGQLMVAYTTGTTGPSTPPRPDYWGEVRFTVTCNASDALAPRINRAR